MIPLSLAGHQSKTASLPVVLCEPQHMLFLHIIGIQHMGKSYRYMAPELITCHEDLSQTGMPSLTPHRWPRSPVAGLSLVMGGQDGAQNRTCGLSAFSSSGFSVGKPLLLAAVYPTFSTTLRSAGKAEMEPPSIHHTCSFAPEATKRHLRACTDFM